MKVAIIPARGGSKRLPGKNLAILGGRPLIARSIESSLQSNLFDRVVVSTDSTEIAHVAVSYGAEVGGLRPKALSGDHAASEDVVLHVLADMPSASTVFLLQPTSPFRTVRHLREVDHLLTRYAPPAVVSARKIGKVGSELFFSSGRETQEYLETGADGSDLKWIWQLNGAIYAIRVNLFFEKRTFVPPQTLLYEMSPRDSLDIDTRFDLDIARHFFG